MSGGGSMWAGRRRVRGTLCRASCLALLLGLLSWSGVATGQDDVDRVKAGRVKAAYLRYIAEFTTWPLEAFGGEDAPIVLGIMGEDPHGVFSILEGAIERKGLRAQSRPIVLRRLPESDPAALEAALYRCHLLFLSRSEGDADTEQWAGLHAMLGERPIVTIGEIPGFSQAAGMIEFVIDSASSRVTMHIDLDAVTRARLRLSSRLLGLKQGVKIVRTPAESEACLSEACKGSRYASALSRAAEWEGIR